VFARPDSPKLSNTAEVSDDGRWLIVYSSEGTDDRYDVHLVDLRHRARSPGR
jgi:prolyl oligopeptidase